MKPKLTQVVLIVALSAASLLSWSVYGQEMKSVKVVWEYNIATFTGDRSDQLKELGAQGWELISVRTEEQMVGNYRSIKAIII